VVGAGFTGIELALELRDRVAAHRETGHNVSTPEENGHSAGTHNESDSDARIVLVDRNSVVGRELGPNPRPNPRPVIEAALTDANAARDLLGLPTINYEQLRYVTCLDLGRSGAILTDGWERRIVLS
jgi:hypothetical protein